MWSGEQTELSKSVTFLTEEYDTAFFFWELVEVLKKLLLAGAMSVVMPGELNQLVIAFIIVLCFQTALLIGKPYKRYEDDVLALASGFGALANPSPKRDPDSYGRALAQASSCSSSLH